MLATAVAALAAKLAYEAVMAHTHHNSGHCWHIKVDVERRPAGAPEPETAVDPEVMASVTSIAERLEANGR